MKRSEIVHRVLLMVEGAKEFKTLCGIRGREDKPHDGEPFTFISLPAAKELTAVCEGDIRHFNCGSCKTVWMRLTS